MSESVSKMRDEVDNRFQKFESRHREMRNQLNEMRQQQDEMRQQQDEIRQQQTLMKGQQDELIADVCGFSTAVGGLADTMDDNWKDMSDQNRLMQKTLLDPMEKLLSETEEKKKVQVEQEQVQMKGKTKETKEDVNLTRPAKNVAVGDAVSTVNNVTYDASLLKRDHGRNQQSFRKTD